jgi:uncharacterized tellurite resistance protein B-like protein
MPDDRSGIDGKYRGLDGRLGALNLVCGISWLGLAMFGSIKALILNLVEDTNQRSNFEQSDRLIAIAALLIRVATVHHELSELRRAKLRAILRSCYGLDDIAAVQLMIDADAVAGTAVDLYRFTRKLNEVLDGEGRRRIVQMMWEIVYADRAVNEFEENAIWRAADLLGVSSRQRVELRHGVMANMEALTRVRVPDYPIIASAAVTGD